MSIKINVYERNISQQVVEFDLKYFFMIDNGLKLLFLVTHYAPSEGRRHICLVTYISFQL